MDNTMELRNGFPHIQVLVIVDAQGALSSGNLDNNVYLVDSTKYMGSWNEGSCNLHTVCHNTQQIEWRVVAIDPNSSVDITGFHGTMVDKKVCVPQETGLEGDKYWVATVQTQGNKGRYQYTMNIQFNGGRTMTFDPYIEVK
ncbi:alpha-pore-forming tripartite toxin MakABE regulator [Anaeromicropila populeti]|uniref:Inclusion body protein n=1 Tax=Anaeromicropila populeti TaxID=37658 RepID=A0A1I6JX44_9FIRM|nr:hypothetical protein [Anaeromicropila populeti]SFR83100.1 hypothetical protein SAMN05661086_01994 [Anaeromicropila populeti]